MTKLPLSVEVKYNCLEAVVVAAFDAFAYYSQNGTSEWQRARTGLSQILDGLVNLRLALLKMFCTRLGRDKGIIDQLLENYKRIFAGLEYMDFERAVWSFMTSRQTCDHTFKRLVEFSRLLCSSKCCECWLCSLCDNSLPAGCSSWCIETIPNALWQVSCHIPRELSPSLPPPPYTLYAFNIELPPIRYPAVTARHSSVEKPSRLGKRKRCDSEDVDALRPSMRRICDVEDVEETHPDRRAVSEREDTEDEDEHHPKRRLLKEPENVAYIREQRLLRFQGAV